MATLPGVPFYERCGYVAGPAINYPLPGGIEIRFVPMSKQAPCSASTGLGLFLAAGVLLNLTPGQDTMFIIGQSLTGGFRAGVAAALGIALGTVFHTLAAALGLSAILATSPLAFSIVKFLGAAYLVFLGIKLILSRPAGDGAAARAAPSTPRAVLRQGILTNVLNPKVALFFLAFLPQFVDPSSGSRILAFLVLGAIFISTGFLWCLVLAAASGPAAGVLPAQPNFRSIDRSGRGEPVRRAGRAPGLVALERPAGAAQYILRAL